MINRNQTLCSEEKFKEMSDDYYNQVFFNLISEFINHSDVLQKENLLLKEQYDFISLFSHQLRTPISVAKMSLETIQETGIERELSGIAYENICNMGDIVEKLLLFIEVSNGTESAEKTAVSISEIVKIVLDKLSGKIKVKKIKIILNKEKEDDVSIISNKDRLEKIISFLIDNAVVYGKEEGSVWIKIFKNGNEAKFSVKDDGYGIPEEERAMIFSKFFRATNASLGKNEGSGVSLYMAKLFVESLGGKMEYKNEKDGSEFYFTLPLK